MSSDRIALVQDIRADTAVSRHKGIRQVNQANLVVDSFVDKQWHLWDSVVAHLSVVVDGPPDGRSLEESRAILEIVEDILIVECHPSLHDGHISYGQERCLVERTRRVELGEEIVVCCVILARQAHET